MNSGTYKNLLRIFERWPLDAGKSGGRDLGEFIRIQVGQHFSSAKSGQLDLNAWDEIAVALARIESDKYKNLFPCSRVCTASGLSLQECTYATSNEFLKENEEENMTIRGRLSRTYLQVSGTLKAKITGHVKNLLSQCIRQPGRPFKATECGYVKCMSTATSNKTNESSPPHIPVMLNEVLFYLDAKPGQTLVDMTFGSGGHSRKILETVPDVRIFGLDRDPVGISYAQKLAAEYPGQVIPLLGRFSEIKTLLLEHDVTEVDGILFDLGCSSMQFDDPTRGFGVSFDGPLDMRMDGQRFPNLPTAAEVVKHVDEDDLLRIIRVYGEEIMARKIVRAIVESRYMFQTLETTTELAALVATALSKDARIDKLQRPAHSATKTFQALRIFVNNELNEINRGIELAYQLLKPDGVTVALTFHSLEDRIVKRHLVGIEMDEPITKSIHQKYMNALNTPTVADVEQVYTKKWSPVTKHVLNPTFYEAQKFNPRSRSAKLRCATKNG